ncbi:MAG: gamma-glutamylcyclotransferase [Oscillospiraceae bacterium]|jgi:gamma-glutamylcyclotransferase (GGCT)/AIG2-like uncharacterized protein YtfP|nr:gamma-glutamylcyclotransferase [Oscillospiraceae bacterium]
MKRQYYLAYGSNLNIGQMQFRCPAAEPVGKTLLTGYRLTFCGGNGSAVANIEPDNESIVPCALWRITAEDERALDGYEGFPYLYHKTTVRVPFGKRKISAMVYVMEDGHPVGMPGRGYLRTILEGYADFELDTFALAEAVRTSVAVHEPYGSSE